MLSPSTIERIRNAANIVDVVGEYVSLRRAGSSFRGLCPFHDDTTPSFYVSPARGICKCFACGEGGDVVGFIMKQEQLGYVDALKFLARKYGIEVEERDLTPEERRAQNERESMFAVNEWASQYFHDILLNTEEGQTIGLAYCRNRGFRDDIISRFRLGFSPSAYDAMSAAALKAGYKEEYLVKTGLSYKRDNGNLNDKYHGRVIFPWFTTSGKVVGFGGRVLDARTKGVSQKYINSPESDIYHKASELYGLFQAKKAISREHNVYMVEGYTDVISMHQCGIENVVANSGTALSEQQISMLHRFTNNITLLYDGDAAGQKAALRGTDMLLARGMRIKILLLPDGDDPDSFARKHSATEFRQYVETHQVDFITFKTNLLRHEADNDPDRMSDLIRSIVESIAVVPEEIERSVYIHRCSEILQIDEKLLLREVSRTRKKNWEQKLREKENAENRRRFTPEADNTHTPQTDTYDTDTPPEVDNTTPSTPDSRPTPLDADPGLTPDQRRRHALEALMMQQIVRYGEQSITIHDPAGATHTTTVFHYITSQLDAISATFQSTLHRDMLDALKAHYPNTSADTSTTLSPTPSQFFLNNPRADFSREASLMLSDQYMLSARDAQEADSMYAEQTLRLMSDYKSMLITIEINSVMQQLNSPEVLGDSQRLMSLMRRQMELTRQKQQLASQSKTL